MLPAEVTMSYENLLAAFEDASVEANCGIVEKAQNPCACFRGLSHDRVSFDCLFHCKDWKWKASTNTQHHTKRVSILVHVHETIRRRDRSLLASSVNVNYLDVNAGQGELLQAFHYDYDPCQRDHALFHAQMTNECISIGGGDIEALKIDFSMPANAGGKKHRSARIPTCDMTFPSVLVSLAADHLGTPFFGAFWTKACELQQKMPLPRVSKLRKSLGLEPRNFRSSHWFSHTR